jgi:hypothetical protein
VEAGRDIIILRCFTISGFPCSSPCLRYSLLSEQQKVGPIIWEKAKIEDIGTGVRRIHRLAGLLTDESRNGLVNAFAPFKGDYEELKGEMRGDIEARMMRDAAKLKKKE